MSYQEAQFADHYYEAREAPVFSSIFWVVFMALHVPLAILMYQVPYVNTVHAWLTLVIGLWLTYASQRFDRVAYVAAYIAGAEVLWRMTQAAIFWEFGKYAIATVFIVALVRHGRLKMPALPLAYFAVLLPSAILTLLHEEFWRARDQISFNLSGPFALMVCAWFFSELKLSAVQIRRLLLAMLAPIIGIVTIAIFVMASNPFIEFTGESNEATSGGYGPNQVSTILGLGVLIVLLSFFDNKLNKWLKALLFLVLVVLAGQSALTFSRGGLYNAAGAALLAAFYTLRDARQRIKLLLVVGLLAVVATFVIYPKLDDFTGGALTDRFESTETTGRDEIVYGDIELMIDNPLTGVGPGQAKIYRKRYGGYPAHTEFTRLLAEHGLLGAAALAILLIAGAQNVSRMNTLRGKAIASSMICWSCLSMMNAAMRLAVPSFVFGLTFAVLMTDE